MYRRFLYFRPFCIDRITKSHNLCFAGLNLREKSDSIVLADPFTRRKTNPLQNRRYETKCGDIHGYDREWYPKQYHPDVHEDRTNPSTPASLGVNGPKPIKQLLHQSSSKLDDNTTSHMLCARTKIGRKLDMLIPGDHVTWQRKVGYWHHAIVVEANNYGINVIQWTKVSNGQMQITKQFLSEDEIMENDADSLYRVHYPKEIEMANDVTLVLGRAFSRLGDKKYGLLDDNCKSFATFCKTGCEKPHQALWLADIMRKVTLVESDLEIEMQVLAKSLLGRLSVEAAEKECFAESIEKISLHSMGDGPSSLARSFKYVLELDMAMANICTSLVPGATTLGGIAGGAIGYALNKGVCTQGLS